LVARSQEQDRELPVGALHLAQDFPSINAGQHHVEDYEDYEVVIFHQHQMQPVSPFCRDIGYEASFGQSFLEEFSRFGFVFDEQDFHVMPHRY